MGSWLTQGTGYPRRPRKPRRAEDGPIQTVTWSGWASCSRSLEGASTGWGTSRPAGDGDIRAMGGRKAGRQEVGVRARGAGQGIRAYLNEPVSASLAADCPGTAFRRAHTRTSSSHCAVSYRKGKDRLLPLWLPSKQAHPHRGNSQPPSRRWTGGRETEGAGAGGGP